MALFWTELVENLQAPEGGAIVLTICKYRSPHRHFILVTALLGVFFAAWFLGDTASRPECLGQLLPCRTQAMSKTQFCARSAHKKMLDTYQRDILQIFSYRHFWIVLVAEVLEVLGNMSCKQLYILKNCIRSNYATMTPSNMLTCCSYDSTQPRTEFDSSQVPLLTRNMDPATTLFVNACLRNDSLCWIELCATRCLRHIACDAVLNTSTTLHLFPCWKLLTIL